MVRSLLAKRHPSKATTSVKIYAGEDEYTARIPVRKPSKPGLRGLRDAGLAADGGTIRMPGDTFEENGIVGEASYVEKYDNGVEFSKALANCFGIDTDAEKSAE
jgi:hypothetical protein